MSEGGDKTEQPTDKKLDDARKKGQIWKSRDLTGALVFFVGYAVLSSRAPFILDQFKELFHQAISVIEHPGNPYEDATAGLLAGLRAIVVICLPVVAGAAMVGGLSDFLQVGALFTLEPLAPKLDKMDPIKGITNIFSKKTAIEAVKNMLKVSLALYLAWGVLRDHLPLVVVTIRASPAQIFLVVGELIYRLTIKVGLLLVLTAIFDVWWQNHSYMKDMMMTKDEVKREYKESEGDPHHKSKRKELHQEILEHSSMENVKNADVIITNPTHVAVAIAYDRAADAAPRILCKGIDARAADIRALAKQYDIPMVRNVPLARSLHQFEVGDTIPEELYDAVAEVLNWVYTLEQAAASRAVEPPR
jgi:flagellar biosynthetic protein FlhB